MTNKLCILSNKMLSHGYPRMRIASKVVYMHVIILERKLDRKIRDGYEACHSCGVTNCIEEEHIYEGTHKDNMSDLITKGNTDFFGGYNQKKTHCPRGHKYDIANTYVRPNGRRECRLCWNR